MTHYQRPGFRPLTQVGKGPIRALYGASNGKGFAVSGAEVYYLDPNWQPTKIGDLTQAGTSPCSMIDNEVDLVLADNSTFGYSVDLATNQFSVLNDPSGTFIGANKLDIIDGYVLFNIPGTPTFGSTLENVLTVDPLYTAAKNNYPGNLVTLGVNRHEILLLGTKKSEIWYNAGNPQFPFAELPGSSIEHGCVAPYSFATMDVNAYWLGADLQGDGIVFRQTGYTTRRISNHALEVAIRQMKRHGIISDAIGYTHQQDGHTFYVLCFPSGDQTWVFDEAIGDPNLAWTQRAWTDANGVLHRDRSNCGAVINGLYVVGDWQNGTIYHLDPDTYTDTVDGVVGPISFIRTFPHIFAGDGPQGPVLLDGKQVQVTSFIADVGVGDVPLDAQGQPAQMLLRTSLDRGRTWGQALLQSLGAPGEFLTQPLWRQLGIGRDIIFELSYACAGEAPLNGAWIEMQVLNK